MRSALPKVLHPIGGRPMLSHVVDAARELSPSRIIVVYGHGGEQVRDTLADPQLEWALQDRQLGTGHAVSQALPLLDDDGLVLVLYGDVPLIRSATLKPLLQAAADGLALLTVELADPAGYGRIVRATDGRVACIVEEKDASAEQKSIREVNTGLRAVSARHLKRWLGALKNDTTILTR